MLPSDGRPLRDRHSRQFLIIQARERPTARAEEVGMSAWAAPLPCRVDDIAGDAVYTLYAMDEPGLFQLPEVAVDGHSIHADESFDQLAVR